MHTLRNVDATSLNTGKYDNVLPNLSIILFIIFANYNAPLDIFISNTKKSLFLIITLCIGFFSLLLKYKIKLNILNLCWLFFSFIIIFDRNEDFINGNPFFVLRILIAIGILFLPYKRYTQSLEKIPGYIWKIGFVNVFFTWLFYFIPSLYQIVTRFYLEIPAGTDSGLHGYKAGIQNHYSQNGTYIAFVVLILITILVIKKSRNQPVGRSSYFISAVSLLALILTTKRAHILFVVCSLVIVYYVVNKNHKANKILKLLITFLILILMLVILKPLIPQLQDILNRFAVAGKDSQSISRFKMWKLAIENFKDHPFFGIGWGGFKYQYAIVLYKSWQSQSFMYLNAHNVYIQLLCEVGIVGTSIYIFALATALKETVKTLKIMRLRDNNLLEVCLGTSLSIQIFYILYSFTGNCLYDYSLIFYMISIFITMNIRNDSSKKHGEEF